MQKCLTEPYQHQSRGRRGGAAPSRLTRSRAWRRGDIGLREAAAAMTRGAEGFSGGSQRTGGRRDDGRSKESNEGEMSR